MRRVWAAIAGSLLLWTTCVVALSASAHEEHADWFKWREPEENSDVSGPKVTLRAKVTFQEGVKRWMLEVLPPDGYATVTSWGTVCESGEKDKKQKAVEITCEWNSSAYPDGKPSRNHAYRARVTAWNDDGSSGSGGGDPESGGEVKTRAAKDDDKPTTSSSSSTTSTTDTTTTTGEEDTSSTSSPSSTSSSSSTSSTSSSTTSSSSTTTTTTKGAVPGAEAHEGPVRTLIVANPPSAPEGVRLAYNKKATEATVAWDANPEPDIAHYVVEEHFGDGDWSLVARTTATTWKTRLDEKGTYRFRVGAVRYVGSKERTKEGPRREPQSGMRKVEADPDKDRDKDTTGSTQPQPATAEGKRKDQEEGKKKDPEVETTTTTAPPASVIVNYDGTGDPASTSTTGAAGTALRPGLSPIEAGAPGSVQTRYADPPRLPAPATPEQAYDPGFSLALPYPKEVRLDIVPPPPPAPRLLGTVVLFDSNEEQRRALVGVLAGGLVMFIVGMQAAYLNRRPRPIDLAASGDWD